MGIRIASKTQHIWDGKMKAKVFTIAILVLVIFFGVWYVKKQWFDDGSVFTTSTISSDKVSRLAAAGGDLRIYEFTPQTAKHMQCVFIAGENKGSTFCFKKEKGYVENSQNTP